MNLGITILILCIAVVAGGIFYLLKDGFINFKATNWEVKEGSITNNWEDIFSRSQNLEVTPLFNGISKEIPGARPWLDEETIPEDYDRFAPSNCPTMNFSVSHSKYGDILIDAGMNSSFNKSNTSGDLSSIMKIYQKNSKYHYDLGDNDNIKYNIKKHNLDPKYVFITHIHPDHVAGLTEVPSDAVAVIGKKENSFIYRLIGGKYFKNIKTVKTLDFTKAKKIGPFSKVIDLLGDSSIFAISSPGHSEDHISYLINDTDNPVLIVGDLIISEDYFNRGIEVSCDSSSRDKGILKNSLKEFSEFKEQFPNVKVCYMHFNG